ncbi:MAG: hypothetical protein HQL91_04920 [Magnetococcales bacterium]|nr:hypothetical protein [Magnetococcales bacterium]
MSSSSIPPVNMTDEHRLYRPLSATLRQEHQARSNEKNAANEKISARAPQKTARPQPSASEVKRSNDPPQESHRIERKNVHAAPKEPPPPRKEAPPPEANRQGRIDVTV